MWDRIKWFLDWLGRIQTVIGLPAMVLAVIAIWGGWKANLPPLVLVGIALVAVDIGLYGVHHWHRVESLIRPGRPRTEEVFTDRQRALVVSWLGEQWTSFQHKVRFLKIHYAIRNRTGEPIPTENWKLEISGMHHGFDRDVSQERERLKREFPAPPHMIPAKTRVEGWWIVELEYGPGQGEPDYTLSVHSARGGHEYGFSRKGNPKVPIAAFVPNESSLAPLEIRHRPQEPYAFARVPGRPPNVHYIGIYNPRANPPVTRVQMQILGMNPVPNDHGNSPEFPAAVPRRTGGDPRSGVTLEPDTEELWEIATADPDGEGNFFVREIALPAWPLGRNQMWTLRRGDSWRLRFQLSADGLGSRSFQVLMQVAGDAVQCQLEGVTP